MENRDENKNENSFLKKIITFLILLILLLTIAGIVYFFITTNNNARNNKSSDTSSTSEPRDVTNLYNKITKLIDDNLQTLGKSKSEKIVNFYQENSVLYFYAYNDNHAIDYQIDFAKSMSLEDMLNEIENDSFRITSYTTSIHLTDLASKNELPTNNNLSTLVDLSKPYKSICSKKGTTNNFSGLFNKEGGYLSIKQTAFADGSPLEVTQYIEINKNTSTTAEAFSYYLINL